MATSFELPPPPPNDPAHTHPDPHSAAALNDHTGRFSRKRKVEFLYSHGGGGSDASSDGDDKAPPSSSARSRSKTSRPDDGSGNGEHGVNPLRKRSRTYAPGTNAPTNLGGAKDDYYKRWLYRYMQVLDHSQLVNILCKLPEDVLSSLLEKPTVGNVEKYLVHLEKKLVEAFPYSKNGRKDNDYSFNRVRPMLADIQETLLEFASYFESTGDLYTTTTYLAFATSLAFRLPNFTSPTNASLKHDLIIKLSGHWQRSITSAIHKTNTEGRMWGENVVREWHGKLWEFEVMAKEMLNASASRASSRSISPAEGGVGRAGSGDRGPLQERASSSSRMDHSPSPGASPRRRYHSQMAMSTSPVPTGAGRRDRDGAGNEDGDGQVLFESTRGILERELGWMMPFMERRMIMANG